MENFVDITPVNAIFEDVTISGIIVAIVTNYCFINCSVYNNSSVDNRGYVSNSGSSSYSRSSSCSSNRTSLTLCGKEHLDLCFYALK